MQTNSDNNMCVEVEVFVPLRHRTVVAVHITFLSRVHSLLVKRKLHDSSKQPNSVVMQDGFQPLKDDFNSLQDDLP